MNKREDDLELREMKNELWSIEADVRHLICKLSEILNQVVSISKEIEKVCQK